MARHRPPRSLSLKHLPDVGRRGRYLVVDRDDRDDSVALPAGLRGKVVARFHTRDLAEALVSAERLEGRRLLVVDSTLAMAAAARSRGRAG